MKESSIKNRLREFHRRHIMNDPFNHPAMIAAMDAAAALFPNQSADEAAIRDRDREALTSEQIGEPVPHAPGLVDGRLNRDKILMGASYFAGGNHAALTPHDFQLIADAGFDFLILCASGETRELGLNECEKHGVAVIAPNEALPAREEAKNGALDFSGYRKHPALAGDMGWDEPNAARFDAIAAYVKAYREALPGQFLFNNLFPDGTMPSLLGVKTYREYVDRWADTVDADYICLDHYPFYCSSLFNRFGFRIALNTYDCVAAACRRKGRDFWLYLQTQGNWFAHLYLLVTFEQIKWQVYTALCYGARSIIQVAYRPAWGNDAVGMTDKDGNLTEQYLYAKQINAEVQKLSPVLSPYRSLGVLCAEAHRENGDFRAAVKQQKQSSREQGFYGVPQVLSVRSDTTALVGCFENKQGGKALMLVNCRDLFDAKASQVVRVALNDVYRVRVYQKGELVLDTRSSAAVVTLDSCGGAFITIDKLSS